MSSTRASRAGTSARGSGGRDTTGRSAAYPARALGIIATSLGAAGLLLSFLGWAFALSIGAIVFALIARSRESGRALWIAGLALGIVGLIASAVSLYFQVLALSVLTTLDLG